jgi:hypothetical protein
VRYAAQSSVKRTAEKWLDASVRSVNGTLVWKKTLLCDGSPIGLTWNCTCPNGQNAAPGIYFLTLAYNGEQYRQKFIIAE